MGFVPDHFQRPPVQRSAPLTEAACAFCAQRPPELYMLPTFGLASPGDPVSLACADCYQQTTFTRPRPAARVVRPS
jgi:hypothetical protein